MRAKTENTEYGNFYKKEQQYNRETAKQGVLQTRSPKGVVFADVEEGQNVSKVVGMGQSPPKNDSYAGLLREQMSLRLIDEENELARSRKADNENARYNLENYRYGEEGVRVKEEVVEKYKASNYVDQRSMLEKFKAEAQMYRRQRFKQHPNNNITYKPIPKEAHMSAHVTHRMPQAISNSSSYMAEQHNQMLALEKIREEDERRRRKEKEDRERRKKQRRQMYRQREQENLVHVGNMLRDIGHKIKNNADSLNYSLVDLRRSLNPSKPVRKYDEDSFIGVVSKIAEGRGVGSRVPVIRYNNQIDYPQLPQDNPHLQPDIIDRSHTDGTNMGQIVSILRKNQKRLEILTNIEK